LFDAHPNSRIIGCSSPPIAKRNKKNAENLLLPPRLNHWDGPNDFNDCSMRSLPFVSLREKRNEPENAFPSMSTGNDMQDRRTCPIHRVGKIVRDSPGFDLRPVVFFKFGPVVGGCCNSYACVHNFVGQCPEPEKPLAVYKLLLFFFFPIRKTYLRPSTDIRSGGTKKDMKGKLPALTA
jgi:hypothetical protein